MVVQVAPRKARFAGLSLLVLALAGVLWLSRSEAPTPGPAESASASPAVSAEARGASEPLVVDERCRAGTVRLLQAAPSVRVALYASGGAPVLDRARDAILRLLGEYEQEAAPKLEVELLSVESDASRERAKKAGIEPVSVVLGPDQTVQAYLGLEIHYGEQRGSLAVDPAGVERSFAFFFANKLRELSALGSGTRYRIGRVAGAGELSLAQSNLLPALGSPGPSLEQLLTSSFPFYAFEPVDLRETKDISELSALVLTQPGRTLEPAELRRLDEFLTQGGKTLIVAASAVNVKAGDDAFGARLDARGVDVFLRPYGVELGMDVLIDAGAPLELIVRAEDGDKTARVPHILVAKHDPALPVSEQALDSTFPAFFGLERLAFPLASTLTLRPEAQPRALLRAVARSSPRVSAGTNDRALEIRLPAEVPPSTEPRVLAAVVEGELKSAFSDRVAEGRLVVIASSQFAANPFVLADRHEEEGSGHEAHKHAPPPPNPQLVALGASYAQQELTRTILVWKQLLDWATGNETLLPCGASLVARPE